MHLHGIEKLHLYLNQFTSLYHVDFLFYNILQLNYNRKSIIIKTNFFKRIFFIKIFVYLTFIYFNFKNI